MPLHTQETRQKRAICVQFGEKNSGGGHVSSFKRGGGISKGGHVSSFERGGPLAWEVHWHGGEGWQVLPPNHTHTKKADIQGVA